jgi:DNA polymerase I-like protein with 3'-5' exonuclease and polymerase domains
VLESEYYRREAELIKAVNIPGFRCTPDDMRRIIYKRHETKSLRKFSLPDPLDPKMYTDEEALDKISVKKEALLLLFIDPGTPDELRIIIDLYWQAESVWKARSTYVVSDKVSHAIGPDGRLRAGWNSCGTDTGRWSCSEPNLQNLSEGKEEESSLGGDLPSMRSMYRASTGRILVHGDWKQQELRMLAYAADDTVLEAALDSSDPYVFSARQFFGLDPKLTDDQIKKEHKAKRKGSKIIILQSGYAAGTPSIYSAAIEQDRSIKYSTVAMLHNQYKQMYNRVVSYWAEEQDRVWGKEESTGYSESRILHRRRVYPSRPDITEVANYPIQSTASDIANLAMIELDRRLKKFVPEARILTQLHDAFDVECPYRDQRVVKDIMKECMEAEYEINGRKRSFPVDFKIADRWSDV